jgi:thiamine-monophosphate kinase
VRVTGPVREHALIERLAGAFRGSPRQLNRRHESDAELLRLPGTDAILALTTDALAEEIASGLYREPWLIGWMTVTANASDLAAVGAEPLGILVSIVLPPDASDDLVAGLRAGLGTAADAHGLPVIGGDTNRGATLALTGAAAGLVSDGRPLTRRGARPGDRLFASGPLGLGGAYALGRLLPGSAPEIAFRPLARLSQGRLLRPFASSAMDTSDGLIATLDELARRNACGFSVSTRVEEVLHRDALCAATAAHLPPWLMLAAPHGEFELAFTVPSDRCDALAAAAADAGWAPVELGVATGEPGVVRLGAEGAPIDTTRVRNLFDEVGGDVHAYVRELMTMAVAR